MPVAPFERLVRCVGKLRIDFTAWASILPFVYLVV